MARPQKLSEAEIQDALHDLPHWVLDGKTIVREKSAANFAAVVGIVNAIAIIAESMDHHPDILIYGWNKLRIMISTHDIGGLSALDFKLAHKIEELNL